MAKLKSTNVSTSLLLDNVDIFSLIYPIGSIYMSVNDTNPSSLFGGTWVAWGSGRVPVGVGSNGTTNYSSVEATGGAESRSHSHGAKTSGTASGNTGATALTVSQIPAHTHSLSKALIENSQENSSTYGLQAGSSSFSGRIMLRRGETSTSLTPVSANATGGGGSHTHTLNNHTHSVPASDSKSTDVRQPYITCYMWKRTA